MFKILIENQCEVKPKTITNTVQIIYISQTSYNGRIVEIQTKYLRTENFYINL